MWASKRKNSQTQGFTIIEVVLVLAIAGLIFLIVFLALPALQKNQRDTGRKNSLGLIVSLVTSYRANSGMLLCTDTSSNPPTWCGNQAAGYNASYNTFVADYLTLEHRKPDEFAAKTTHFYAYLSTHPVAYSSDSWVTNATLPPGTIVIAVGAKCDGGRLTFNPADKGPGLAAWIKTETGVGACRVTT